MYDKVKVIKVTESETRRKRAILMRTCQCDDYIVIDYGERGRIQRLAVGL